MNIRKKAIHINTFKVKIRVKDISNDWLFDFIYNFKKQFKLNLDKISENIEVLNFNVKSITYLENINDKYIIYTSNLKNNRFYDYYNYLYQKLNQDFKLYE
jgi:hypothetical protein